MSARQAAEPGYAPTHHPALLLQAARFSQINSAQIRQRQQEQQATTRQHRRPPDDEEGYSTLPHLRDRRGRGEEMPPSQQYQSPRTANDKMNSTPSGAHSTDTTSDTKPPRSLDGISHFSRPPNPQGALHPGLRHISETLREQRNQGQESENAKLKQRLEEMEKHMLEAGKAMARREDEHAREKEHCARLLIAATRRTTTTAGTPAPTRRISFADKSTNGQPEQRQPDQSSSADKQRGANGGDGDDEGDDDDGDDGDDDDDEPNHFLEIDVPARFEFFSLRGFRII